MRYDLLIKAQQVLDPGQGHNGPLDIGIADGRIAAIQPSIPAEEARRTIEVSSPNHYVVPGLIDPHAHVAWGATTLGVGMECVDPDLAGIFSGVTTVGDGGSVGVANVGVFTTHLVPRSRTRIVCFLNAGSYAHTMPGLPDIVRIEDVDRAAIASCIGANPGLVAGIKLRLVGPIMEERGEEIASLVMEIAREHGLPLMVHIGDWGRAVGDELWGLTRFVLNRLQAGDILTHLFTPNVGGVLCDGAPVPELLEARMRGVLLDPAMGGFHFDFDIARRLADQGVRPDTISTDLTAGGRPRVGGLLECMGRFMALGYSLAEVVSMTTTNAARALQLQDQIGAIAVGREADLTILNVVPGPWSFVDTKRNRLVGEHALAPVQTVRGGRLIAPDWGPHPWGWLPDAG